MLGLKLNSFAEQVPCRLLSVIRRGGDDYVIPMGKKAFSMPSSIISKLASEVLSISFSCDERKGMNANIFRSAYSLPATLQNRFISLLKSVARNEISKVVSIFRRLRSEYNIHNDYDVINRQFLAKTYTDAMIGICIDEFNKSKEVRKEVFKFPKKGIDFLEDDQKSGEFYFDFVAKKKPEGLSTRKQRGLARKVKKYQGSNPIKEKEDLVECIKKQYMSAKIAMSVYNLTDAQKNKALGDLKKLLSGITEIKVEDRFLPYLIY